MISLLLLSTFYINHRHAGRKSNVPNTSSLTFFHSKPTHVSTYNPQDRSPKHKTRVEELFRELN